MDKRTADALEASIKHWEENVAAETRYGTSTGPSECALCRLFWEKTKCDGCPVFARTGHVDCDSSPYVEADSARRAWNAARPESEAAMKARWRTAAKAELDFLISLREPATP